MKRWLATSLLLLTIAFIGLAQTDLPDNEDYDSFEVEPPELLLKYARKAEELGFEGVVLPDHVVVKEKPRTPHPSNFELRADHLFVDPLIAYTAMATVTTRLKFLSYVYVVPLRDPFTLAKQASSVAVMSNNRYILGTGVGWLKEEFETMGQDFHTRGKRMDEMLTIVRDFWDDGYAEFKGEFFNFPRSGMFPVPERPIPIWIGGHSMPAARRAAHFDGYMPMRPLLDPDGALDAQTQAFDYGCKVAGCTVHFVDEHLDHGVIILQRTVPVLGTDDAHTLAERILVEEHQAYAEAIRRVLSGQYAIQGRRYLPVSA